MQYRIPEQIKTKKNKRKCWETSETYYDAFCSLLDVYEQNIHNCNY